MRALDGEFRPIALMLEGQASVDQGHVGLLRNDDNRPRSIPRRIEGVKHLAAIGQITVQRRLNIAEHVIDRRTHVP